MKRVIGILAVALIAMPVMAGMSTATPFTATVKDASSDARFQYLYADLVTCGYYLNNGTGAAYPLPIADDIHAVGGGLYPITTFTFGYYAPTVTNFTLTVAFYTNGPGDTPVPGAGAVTIAAYGIGPLPAGAWIISVTGVSVAAGPDFWFEEHWASTTPPMLNGGPLLTCNPGGTMGYSHNLFAQTGSTWVLGVWSDFVLGFIPEPASIFLLALGGLAALRRR